MRKPISAATPFPTYIKASHASRALANPVRCMANQRIPYYKLEVIAAALPKRYCPKCAGLVKAVDRLMAQQYLTQLAAGAADQSER
jgi:hypothetical protein